MNWIRFWNWGSEQQTFCALGTDDIWVNPCSFVYILVNCVFCTQTPIGIQVHDELGFPVGCLIRFCRIWKFYWPCTGVWRATATQHKCFGCRKCQTQPSSAHFCLHVSSVSAAVRHSVNFWKARNDLGLTGKTQGQDLETSATNLLGLDQIFSSESGKGDPRWKHRFLGPPDWTLRCWAFSTCAGSAPRTFSLIFFRFQVNIRAWNNLCMFHRRKWQRGGRPFHIVAFHLRFGDMENMAYFIYWVKKHKICCEILIINQQFFTPCVVPSYHCQASITFSEQWRSRFVVLFLEWLLNLLSAKIVQIEMCVG